MLGGTRYVTILFERVTIRVGSNTKENLKICLAKKLLKPKIGKISSMNINEYLAKQFLKLFLEGLGYITKSLKLPMLGSLKSYVRNY